MKTLGAFLVAMVMVSPTFGATKTRCEVVKALRAQGVPDRDLRDCKYNCHTCKTLPFNVRNGFKLLLAIFLSFI